jgi:glycosyltransferase involved in cell wall biosynthesis
MTSVIICFYERLAHLKCCLDSLALCAEDFDEVVISDDGSSEATVNSLKKMLSDYPFPIRHVYQPKQGFRVAAARNNGIRHSRGDYLIFFDCDFIVLPGTIRYHLKAAKPGRFVAGSCKYLTEEQASILLHSTISSDLIEQYYRQLPEKDILSRHRRYIKRTILMKLHLASPLKQSLGGHLSLYKKDIERINGYNEDFIGWGGEDEDVGIRLTAAGIYCISAVRYARMLHVWHANESKTDGRNHGREGTIPDYFTRKKIPSVCKNGLRKLILA